MMFVGQVVGVDVGLGVGDCQLYVGLCVVLVVWQVDYFGYYFVVCCYFYFYVVDL